MQVSKRLQFLRRKLGPRFGPLLSYILLSPVLFFFLALLFGEGSSAYDVFLKISVGLIFVLLAVGGVLEVRFSGERLEQWKTLRVAFATESNDPGRRAEVLDFLSTGGVFWCNGARQIQPRDLMNSEDVSFPEQLLQSFADGYTGEDHNLYIAMEAYALALVALEIHRSEPEAREFVMHVGRAAREILPDKRSSEFTERRIQNDILSRVKA